MWKSGVWPAISAVICVMLAGCAPQAAFLMDSSGMAARNIGGPIQKYIYWTNVSNAEELFIEALTRSLSTCQAIEDGEQPMIMLATKDARFMIGLQPVRSCKAYAVFSNMTLKDAGFLATTIDTSDLRNPAVKILYPDQLQNALTALRSRRENRPSIPMLSLLSIFGIE